MYVDNRKKDILILSKSPTQGLHNTTLTAERKYAINFIKQLKKYTASIIMVRIIIYSLAVMKYPNSKQKVLKLMQLHYVWVVSQKMFQLII